MDMVGPILWGEGHRLPLSRFVKTIFMSYSSTHVCSYVKRLRIPGFADRFCNDSASDHDPTGTIFLLFEEQERRPADELALQFEAISQLPPEEQTLVKEVLDSLFIKYQTRRWDSARIAAK